MSRTGRLSLLFLVICAVSLGACSSPTPLERVDASRAEYKASLNSFFVQETPLVEEAAPGEGVEGEEEMGEEATGEPPAGSEEIAAGEEEALVVPGRLDAVLDVIVQHDSRSPLDGVTLDITMVDGEQRELARWTRWVDTAGLPKANQRPFSIVLEDVDYEEGYGFYVEVRPAVPAAERGAYREYDGL
ncbi:MAG: hypothetical protein OEP45_09240 [Acidobacteriota bacterium]|nr:hypothetical protein [Acidobacteriota bacterium]